MKRKASFVRPRHVGLFLFLVPLLGGACSPSPTVNDEGPYGSTSQALSSFDCLNIGGFCDAANQCVRYEWNRNLGGFDEIALGGCSGSPVWFWEGGGSGEGGGEIPLTMEECALAPPFNVASVPPDDVLFDPAVWDPAWYVSHYAADTCDVGITTAEAARAHYRAVGFPAGRRPGPSFDPREYIALSPDLRDAFGCGNVGAAFTHFHTNGQFEGRPSFFTTPAAAPPCETFEEVRVALRVYRRDIGWQVERAPAKQWVYPNEHYRLCVTANVSGTFTLSLPDGSTVIQSIQATAGDLDLPCDEPAPPIDIELVAPPKMAPLKHRVELPLPNRVVSRDANLSAHELPASHIDTLHPPPVRAEIGETGNHLTTAWKVWHDPLEDGRSVSNIYFRVSFDAPRNRSNREPELVYSNVLAYDNVTDGTNQGFYSPQFVNPEVGRLVARTLLSFTFLDTPPNMPVGQEASIYLSPKPLVVVADDLPEWDGKFYSPTYQPRAMHLRVDQPLFVSPASVVIRPCDQISNPNAFTVPLNTGVGTLQTFTFPEGCFIPVLLVSKQVPVAIGYAFEIVYGSPPWPGYGGSSGGFSGGHLSD